MAVKSPVPGSGGIRAVLVRSLKGAIYGFIPLIGFYIGQKLGGVGWAVAVGGLLSLAVDPARAANDRTDALVLDRDRRRRRVAAALALLTDNPKHVLRPVGAR